MTCHSARAAARGRATRRARFASACAAAAILTAAAGQAKAADWIDDTLRGSYSSSAPMRWDGVYFGGQIGVANSNADFGNTTSDFVATSLRQTALGTEIH